MQFKKGDNVILPEYQIKMYNLNPEAEFIEYRENPDNAEGYVSATVKAWTKDGRPFGTAGIFWTDARKLALNKYVPAPVTVPTDVEALGHTTLRHPSSQRFHDIIDELKALHDKKQADYGGPDDPFANVRAALDFGTSAWVGCMIRANDKMRRIQAAAKGSELKNEGVEDSLRDLAVYSIIGLILYQEENGHRNKVAV